MKGHTLLFLLLPGLSIVGCGGTSSKLLLAGPLAEFEDRKPIPEPKAATPNQYYDFVDRTGFKQIQSCFDLPRHARWLLGMPKQAMNVDAFDEVPNSSWFTNRAYTLSLEEILRGPNRVDGPDQSEPWVVKGVKTQGVTPGFRIKDRRGDTYLLKFDPRTNPEMASGAEFICTKLAYAVGYNTPENYLVFFTSDQLKIEGEVIIKDELGDERTLTSADVKLILERVPKMPDGRIRALASKFLSGKPKGPYSYLGTRSDDPNDVFRHEHRRELRGLYVFASFINHNDIRRINSLDMYTPERYLRHYLIDFGSTLGSASVAANLPSEGFEYQLDFSEMTKSLVGFGLYKRPWQRVNLDSDIPSIGYFSGEHFNPGDWKPNYPNLAFQRLTHRDGFWGAKLVMSFSNEAIEGIVKQAQYSDPRAEAYMIDALIKRRDRIGRYWYSRVNPLDWFEVTSVSDGIQTVKFTDLAVEAGFESAEESFYRYTLMHNKPGGGDQALTPPQTWVARGEIVLSHEVLSHVASFCTQKHLNEPDDRLFYLKIRTRRGTQRAWGKWIKVHVLYQGAERGFRLTGIERED